MPNNLFNRFAEKARKAQVNMNGSRESIDWFRGVVTKSGSIPNIGKVTENLQTSRFRPGEMITYAYDPKLADKLDYYDMHPLIIFLERTANGWYGLNIHYIPPVVRAKIFSELLYNSKSLSYVANSLAGDKRMKVCLRRYLLSQTMSKPKTIPKSMWEIAISLPYDKFIKENKKTVWQLGKKNVRNR